MNLFATSRNTLSLFTLFAAGTLSFPATLAAETREQISVNDEAELRAALSEKYQPDGTTEEKDRVFHNNADITLGAGFFVTTTRTQDVEIKDDDGNVTGTETKTYADNGIVVNATGCKLFGAGNTISSSEISPEVSGSGDLFFLSGVSLAVENITFAGTTDTTKKTGRVFTMGNSLFSTLDIGAGTVFENRRLVADENTNYRAQGGAIASAHIMDEISLTTDATDGGISFRGNVADGGQNFSANGGAVATSGLFAISGSGETIFENNAAISGKETAAGGAIFVANASLNTDGSLSSSSTYPGSYDGDLTKKKFGLQVSGTQLIFSENFARGANAQGGAVAVAGGYFDATNATISFDGNFVESTAAESSLFGGALLVAENGRATFDAGTTLELSGNSAKISQNLTVARGGAVAVADSELSFAGTTTFLGNKIESAFGGSVLSGGALYATGKLETVTESDGTKTQKHTTNITLAGTLAFSQNTLSATGLSAEKNTGTTESPKTEIVESSAQGGAIALVGGKIDGANLTLLSFKDNSVSAKTFAQGGALALLDDATALTLKTSGEFSFVDNSAILRELDAGEEQTANLVPVAQGGAIYIAAGTADLSAAGTLNFSGNKATSAQENGLAQGGAIFQSAGTLTLGAADFSENSVTARIAQGGAVYAAGGEMNFADARFSLQNQARAGTGTSDAGTTFARGGAIFAERSAILNFSGTTEFIRSGAIAESASGTGTNGAKSGAAGGAIYSAGALNFESVSFTNGSATVSGDENGAAFGGAVYVAGGKFSAQSVSAIENFAQASGSAFGGAIYTDSAAILDVSGNFTVSGSSVSAKSVSGGAIYSAGTVHVGGKFSATGNSATGENDASGAIAVTGGTFSVNGNFAHEISGNKVSASGADGRALGGAIYVAGGSFSQTAGTLKLSGNTASGTTALGGAIYLGGGNVELANATLENNSATLGGAIFIDAGAQTASTLKLFGNTNLSGNGDGICVGVGTGTDAKSSVSIVLDTKAEEAATISDKISADKATLSLTKTGAGSLALGEISAANDAKISMNFEGGETTLGGNVSVLENLSVSEGATVSVQKIFGGYKSAEIAGTLSVGSGAEFTFADGAETKLSGTLAFDGATANISGAANISGSGTFSVKNATFDFADAAASLTTGTLNVGAGTLTLNGAGTLSVTEKLVFTETGASEIALNGATLGIVEVARTADGVNANISGTGKLILYVEADDKEPPTRITFSEFFEKTEDETTGEETKTVYKGSFKIANTVTVEAGLFAGDGVTLKLSPDAQVAGSKNILLKGGTLLTEAGKTLSLETFGVSSDAKSVLGAAGESQTFEMVAATAGEAEEKISISGELEITETTTLVGDAAFGGKSSALSGAGTLRGNLSGTGTVSLAKIDGNINVNNNEALAVGGAVSVSGDVNIYAERTAGTTANAKLNLANGTALSAANFNNFGVVNAGEATLSGNIVNAGKLVVAKDSTLTIAAGSTFGNGFSDTNETLAGTIDLTAANSAIDFSAVDEANITLDNGKVKIDATTLSAGNAIPILGIEDAAIFENLKIEDVNSYTLSDRFVWDAAAGELVFLGLNGERFRGTLYGDLQRESLNATYDFMRQTLLRGASRSLTPELYGAYKLQSPYMRGYIEKMRRRGGEVSAELEAKRKAELAMAEKLNARSVNFWAQANASFGDHRSRKGFDGYDAEKLGALVGASMPFENWELGLALTGGNENYDMTAATARHEVETDAYGISGYAVYKKDWFDWTVGTAGMFTSSDSKRGELSGDFNGWRLGVMTELGATLRAQSWFALRVYTGLSAAYSYVGTFDETGGDGALSVDSDGAFGVRGTLGISSAFLLSDTLQLKVRAAWLADFGNDTCSLDAYMPGTRTDYVIDSRDNEASALETGASLNWAFSECTEAFFDYTGTIRAGERDHSLSVGVNYFF